VQSAPKQKQVLAMPEPADAAFSKAVSPHAGELGDAASATAKNGEHALQYCPVCSRRLESRRCKLICQGCGYYMSCADYY
jgi:hypothetical protein